MARGPLFVLSYAFSVLSFCLHTCTLTVLLFAFCLAFDCYGCVPSTQSRSGLWGLWDGQAIAQAIARDLAAQYARIALWNVRLIGHACTSLRARDLFLAARAPLLFPARALPSRLRTLAPLPGRVRAPALNLLAGLCICSARHLAIACCMRCAWRNLA